MDNLPRDCKEEPERAGQHAIPKGARSDSYPLSFAQERFWFLTQLEPNSLAYIQPHAIRLRGVLDVESLKKALDAILARHETLRTTFLAKAGTPAQVVGQFRPIDLPMIDLSSVPGEMREAELERRVIDITQRPFDLCRDLMIRVALLKMAATEHVLLVVTHDIASDGWSSSVLFREMAALYEAFSNGRPSPLPELPVQYVDFAVWQRQRLQGEIFESQIAYWRRQLGTSVPVLQLPTDCPRPTVKSYRGAAETKEIPKSLSDSLKELSRRNRITLFVTLLAAFQTLLRRYTGQEDFTVGIPIANRTHVEIEGLIGVFTNTLVLRANLSGNPTFQELLNRVRHAALGAYEHQDLPFEKLVEQINPRRTFGQTPLFQVVFNLRNFPKREIAMPGLTLSVVPVHRRTTKFDLTFFITEGESGLTEMMEYSTDLFDVSTITRMMGHFETLLMSIVAQPNLRLNALQMIPDGQRNQQTSTEKRRKEAKIESLRSARRNAVDLSQQNLIRTDYLQPGKTFPLVVQPNLDDVDIVGWAEGNRDFIEEQLLKHGAILFRGFNVSSAAHFEIFALAICPELFGDYGDLPRVGISGNVYESTPYPPDQAILFHNESAHMHRWPMKQWFFCLQVAQQGGETPIVDGRTLYRQIGAGVLERFANKQIMYVRNFTDNLDVSWQAFFKTSDRSVVESFCRDASIDFEWKENDGLRTRHVCPAVAKHPKTGEIVWFNQLQHWHTAALDRATRQSLLSLFRREDLPRNCYYGDGSPIEDSVMEEISGVYRDCAVDFPWRQGDILMVDNMLTAHARNPYVGPRKILVAMGEMIGIESLSTRNPF